jgi:Leucine-rich repeat (LRR) protein
MHINLKEHLFNSGTSLVLHGAKNLADTDFAQLLDWSVEQRQAITVVVLSNTHITGECFRHLVLLPNLIALYAGGTQVKDDAPFDLLSKTIEILNLDRTEVGDKCISRLRNLPRLRLFSLRQTDITDNALHLLGAMPSLCEYYLNGTSVSDYAKQRLDNAIKLDSITFATALYFFSCTIRNGAEKLIKFTLLTPLNARGRFSI